MSSFFQAIERYERVNIIPPLHAFSADDYQYFQDLFLNKLIEINNNPDISSDDFIDNVKIATLKTNFLYTTRYTEYSIVNFNIFFVVFGIDIELSLSLQYDEQGKFSTLKMHYGGLDTSFFMIKVLGLDFFKYNQALLNFPVIDDSQTDLYSILLIGKMNYVSNSNIISLTYGFDNTHTLVTKHVHISRRAGSVKKQLSVISDVPTELLFIDFVNYLVAKKDDFDNQFCDYKKLHLPVDVWIDVDWLIVLQERFLFLLSSNQRDHFIDYLKVIEMELY